MGTIIAIGNDKGGVGCTTVTANLSVLLQRAGASVELFDCNQSFAPLQDWSLRRQKRGLGKISCQPVSPGSQPNLAGIDYPLVDVGRFKTFTEPLLRLAHVWLAPTPPTFLEVDACIRLHRRWKLAQNHDTSNIFVVVFTKVRPDEKILEHEARLKLALVCPHLVVLNQSLGYHRAWDETFSGQGLSELGSGSATAADTELNRMSIELFSKVLPIIRQSKREDSQNAMI